jgi:hypothetical protein
MILASQTTSWTCVLAWVTRLRLTWSSTRTRSDDIYHNLHRRLVAFLFMYMRQEADRARTQSMFIDAGNRSHPINTCFRRHCSLLEILYYRDTIRRSTMHTMSITEGA